MPVMRYREVDSQKSRKSRFFYFFFYDDDALCTLTREETLYKNIGLQ